MFSFKIDRRLVTKLMDFSTDRVLFAFGLTLLAGLSTGIGSIISMKVKRSNTKFLSRALGFSAGVMIYVSLVDIFVKARESLESVYGASRGFLVTTVSFFAGMALIAIIDKFVPNAENPHEIPDVNEMKDCKLNNSCLLRMGLFSAIAIAIHNFPEGLATFTSAMRDPTLGISIAIAIAIHNIPEGISISVPIYYASGSKRKAFGYSFLSGLSEPLGAIAGYFILLNFFNEATFGIIFAAVAGIMIYISLDELLPTAEKYGEHHVAMYGLIAGMVVMALSLLLFS